MSCLYGAQYMHQADVYDMTEQVVKNTGQKKKTWSFNKTVRCLARPMGRNSMTGSSNEQFSRLYESYTYIRIDAPERINLSSKITNISDGESILWEEDNGKPTVFEVTGLIPITDMFGKIIGWQALCNRSSDQRVNP